MLPENVSAAPELVHLMPATGKPISTRDGRGPYRVTDVESLMAASLAEFDRLPLEENHASDIAAPLGQSAPARGWIVALQAREDGIWGKVEWTLAGQRHVVGVTVMTPTDSRPKMGGILIEDNGTRRCYFPGALARPKIWPEV